MYFEQGKGRTRSTSHGTREKFCYRGATESKIWNRVNSMWSPVFPLQHSSLAVQAHSFISLFIHEDAVVSEEAKRFFMHLKVIRGKIHCIMGKWKQTYVNVH